VRQWLEIPVQAKPHARWAALAYFCGWSAKAHASSTLVDGLCGVFFSVLARAAHGCPNGTNATYAVNGGPQLTLPLITCASPDYRGNGGFVLDDDPYADKSICIGASAFYACEDCKQEGV